MSVDGCGLTVQSKAWVWLSRALHNTIYIAFKYFTQLLVTKYSKYVTAKHTQHCLHPKQPTSSSQFEGSNPACLPIKVEAHRNAPILREIPCQPHKHNCYQYLFDQCVEHHHLQLCRFGLGLSSRCVCNCAAAWVAFTPSPPHCIHIQVHRNALEIP